MFVTRLLLDLAIASDCRVVILLGSVASRLGPGLILWKVLPEVIERDPAFEAVGAAFLMSLELAIDLFVAGLALPRERLTAHYYDLILLVLAYYDAFNR